MYTNLQHTLPRRAVIRRVSGPRRRRGEEEATFLAQELLPAYEQCYTPP